MKEKGFRTNYNNKFDILRKRRHAKHYLTQEKQLWVLQAFAGPRGGAGEGPQGLPEAPLPGPGRPCALAAREPGARAVPLPQGERAPGAPS